ncbi:uncharacterized protein PG998_011916 [Apiospora kogelbergensis]
MNNDDGLVKHLTQKLRALLRDVNPAFGLARIDLTIDAASMQFISAIMDRLHLSPGALWNDEQLIEALPGSYDALFALALSNLNAHPDRARQRDQVNRQNFNALASIYDELFTEDPFMRKLAQRYTWEGRVLDIGCGTGMIGKLLKTYHPNATVEGLDAAESMVTTQTINECYKAPIHVGDMEKILLDIGTVTHSVCYSVFQYVDSITFLATVAQIFSMTEESVSFDVVDITPSYINALSSKGSQYERLLPVDNSASMHRFEVPPGWVKVLEERFVSYTDPEVDMDIFSTQYRFERCRRPLTK